MSITSYSELKTAFATWSKRSGLSTVAEDCIALAEARLNRELPPILTSATLTGTISSRNIDVSANSVAEAHNLFRKEGNVYDEELTQKRLGEFPYSYTNATPRFWSYDNAGGQIVFDCPLDAADTFRFHFKQRYALSDSATTNWLLTNHPDIYLAATIVWGALYTDDDGKAGKWAVLLEQGIPSVKGYISRQQRSRMSVDPALRVPPRFRITTG